MNTATATTPAVGKTLISDNPSANNQRLFDAEQLEGHVQVLRRRLEPGDYLYRAGQPFRAVFLVRVGSVKMCELADDGREQVSGFRLQGEMVGVESIGLTSYTCDVVALESSEIWELAYPAILTACLRVPDLQSRFTAALAQEIRRDRSWMLAIGTLTAEQRVAAFLVDMAARYQALGFSSSHYMLRMCRADMASYLALKHETVSRALSHLVECQFIAVQRRELRILDQAGIRRIAGIGAQVH